MLIIELDSQSDYKPLLKQCVDWLEVLMAQSLFVSQAFSAHIEQTVREM